MTKIYSLGRALFLLCPMLALTACSVTEVPIGAEDDNLLGNISPSDLPPACDASQVCAQVQTCVDGLLYPTACGPKNCDVSTEKCDTPTCPVTAMPDDSSCKPGEKIEQFKGSDGCLTYSCVGDK